MGRRTKQPQPGNKLTQQQAYLLQRIPSLHDMNGLESLAEPAEVKRARKVVEGWEKKQSLRACQQRKRNEALIRKAREAVYFDKPEKALAIVRQCEKLLKGCPV